MSSSPSAASRSIPGGKTCARLRDAGLPVKDIRRLKAEIEHITGIPDEVAFADEIVGIVEYRDGTIIDAIRKIKG